MVTMTSAEAQNNFGKLLDTAQQEPVSITRHGRTVAYLISTREMDDVKDAQERRKAAALAFREWQQNTRLKTTPEMAAAAAKLTEEEINRMVHEYL